MLGIPTTLLNFV